MIIVNEVCEKCDDWTYLTDSSSWKLGLCNLENKGDNFLGYIKANIEPGVVITREKGLVCEVESFNYNTLKSNLITPSSFSCKEFNGA